MFINTYKDYHDKEDTKVPKYLRKKIFHKSIKDIYLTR